MRRLRPSARLSSLMEYHLVVLCMPPEWLVLDLLPLCRRVTDEIVINGEGQEAVEMPQSVCNSKRRVHHNKKVQVAKEVPLAASIRSEEAHAADLG